MRVWSVALEDKYGCILPAQHPIMKFLVVYIGDMHSICCKSKEDGVTPYKNARGKGSQATLIPLGEKVLYKKEKPGNRMNNMDGKFEESIWAGVTGMTNEAVILTGNGAKRSGTMGRAEDRDKYDLQLLNRVRGKPMPEWKEGDEEHEET